MNYTKKKGGGLFKYLPWLMSRKQPSHPIRGELPPGVVDPNSEYGWGGTHHMKSLEKQPKNNTGSIPARKNSGNTHRTHKKQSMKTYTNNSSRRSNSPRRSDRLKSPRSSSRSKK